MRIRVVVVEDSLTVRRRLCEVLGSDPELEVVGEAEDGREAIRLVGELRPDVVTLDMMLPLLDGLATTEHIMAHSPTPILIVSASVNRGELFKTYDALAAGALDVLDKPAGDALDDVWERRLIAAVKLLSRIKVITHLRGKRSSPRAVRDPEPLAPTTGPRPAVIALGASTGGPSALLEVLGALPADYPIPLLVVLHITPEFAPALAEWLESQLDLHVTLARDGQRVSELTGRVALAPPDAHLVVQGGHLRLSDAPERNSCKPSIDVLFESLSREYPGRAAGCLLTGMGRDGAAGLREMRRAGCFTIAQDEATSVVYGMPREAARMGAAERILSLDHIGAALRALGAARPREQT